MKIPIEYDNVEDELTDDEIKAEAITNRYLDSIESEKNHQLITV